MGQRLIIMYSARKGLTPVGIYENLVTTLGGDQLSFANPQVTFSEPIGEHEIATKSSCLPSMNNHLRQNAN
jgi:hypothetical protein